MYGQSGDRGQHCQIDTFRKMDFHILPYTTHRAGRQSAVCLRCWRQLQKATN